jgi:hypothetical protein
MRIWSIHPKYLDAKGLVALWRETLLAKHVLEGKTRGYRNHPQLFRFKSAKKPIRSINVYLTAIYKEAVKRGYDFDKKKITSDSYPEKLSVTRGQVEYERSHLLKKLKIRDKVRYVVLRSEKKITTHPLFIMKNGEIEDWERRGKILRNQT